jgi:hypothetical protein
MLRQLSARSFTGKPSHTPLCGARRRFTIGGDDTAGTYPGPSCGELLMYRIGVLLAGLAVALLLVGDGRSGDKAPQPKTKSNIDLILSLVKLSKEQRSAIEAIQTTFKKKVDELKKQEEQEMMKILTPEQRDQIRRVILENLRKEEAKDKKGG